MVEIGAGLGALTLPLAQSAAKVWAVEVDRGIHAALLEVLAEAGADNVEPLLADALNLDWPDLAARAGGPVVVAGNLPYAISSPLLFTLLDNLACWKRATLMVQKELAERLLSAPGVKDWGRMSVLVQTWCAVRRGMEVGPGQFSPARPWPAKWCTWSLWSAPPPIWTAPRRGRTTPRWSRPPSASAAR